jgi:parallel beta-helix repeat protein
MGGIYLKSENNTIYDNSLINCGILAIEYENNIFNNTVNGKQLVYLYKASNKIFEDVGQVILHKCDNITIKNSFFSNVFIGIEIFESENCYISGNLFAYNTFFCMMIVNSTHNTITGNSFANKVIYNLGGGLFLANSDKNTFSRNTFQNGLGNIWLASSSDNIIKLNNFYFEKRIFNIVASESVNNWEGNFWNRPRLLPYIILIFNPSQIIPSFELDRRPAFRPNYLHEDRLTEDIDVIESKTLNKDVYWNLFSPILNSYPILKKHFGDLVF